jgi:hypothetical protein
LARSKAGSCMTDTSLLYGTTNAKTPAGARSGSPAAHAAEARYRGLSA